MLTALKEHYYHQQSLHSYLFIVSHNSSLPLLSVTLPSSSKAHLLCKGLYDAQSSRFALEDLTVAMRFPLATLATAALIFSASAAPHRGHYKGRNSTDTEQGGKGAGRGRYSVAAAPIALPTGGADLSTVSFELPASAVGRFARISGAKSHDSDESRSGSKDQSSDDSDSPEDSKDEESSGGDKESSSGSDDKRFPSDSGDEESSLGGSSGSGDEESSSGSGGESPLGSGSGSGDEESSTGTGSGSGWGSSSSGGSSSGASSNSTTPSTPSSGGCTASGSFPAAAGESTLSAPWR